MFAEIIVNSTLPCGFVIGGNAGSGEIAGIAVTSETELADSQRW